MRIGVSPAPGVVGSGTKGFQGQGSAWHKHRCRSCCPGNWATAFLFPEDRQFSERAQSKLLRSTATVKMLHYASQLTQQSQSHNQCNRKQKPHEDRAEIILARLVVASECPHDNHDPAN